MVTHTIAIVRVGIDIIGWLKFEKFSCGAAFVHHRTSKVLAGSAFRFSWQSTEAKSLKKQRLKIGLVLVLIASLNFQAVQADQSPLHMFIPVGSDYRQDTLERFAQAAVQRDTNGIVDLLVMPITYGTDAYRTTNGESSRRG